MIDITELVDTFLPVALMHQSKLLPGDAAAIDAVNSVGRDVPERVKAISRWMVDYKIHRAISVAERIALATAALHYFDRPEFPDFARPQGALDPFRELLQILRRTVPPTHRGVDGRFVSMTSKLLWLKRPNAVAIYDSYARFALSGLIKMIFPGDHRMPNVDEYTEFVLHWSTMYDELRPIIAAQQDGYPYTVRLFDKILWLLGNRSYSLYG